MTKPGEGTVIVSRMSPTCGNTQIHRTKTKRTKEKTAKRRDEQGQDRRLIEGEPEMVRKQDPTQTEMSA
jgi:hypothetical protein